jgi:hypothetical protein
MRPRPAGDRAPESARISDLASRLVKDTKEGKPSPIPTKLPKLMTAKPTLPPAYVKLRGEQFCTDAVGQQAYLQQRLGAYPPAPLPVKPILQVSGPSRGWLSVWGSFHVAKLGVTPAWAPACEWPPGWAIVVPRHLTTPPVASGHRAGPGCLYNVSASIWAPPAVSASNPAGNNDCSLLLLQCEMKGNPNAGRTNLPQL